MRKASSCIQTDRHFEHNTLDTVVVDGRNVQIIAVPGDARVENKELEKLTKYRDMAIETSRFWKKHTSVVPVVIGALATISRNFTQYYKQLQISKITPSELQNLAILGTAYTVFCTLTDT